MNDSLNSNELPPELAGVERIPEHIAIIMDGNGRWARARGMTRTQGHEQGVKTLRTITETCQKIGVRHLTVYAFSTDNWKRPQAEVSFLMELLNRYLINERKQVAKNNIRVRAIGRLEGLPKRVQEQLRGIMEESAHKTGLTTYLALNYGAQEEIVDGVRQAMRLCAEGKLNPEDITRETFWKFLYAPEAPPPDLLIRTAGEMRVSNFLLWQIAYTEFWVTPVCWPDFSPKDLYEAIKDFNRRERKFGGIPGAIGSPPRK